MACFLSISISANGQQITAEEILAAAVREQTAEARIQELDQPVKCGFPAILRVMVGKSLTSVMAQVTRPDISGELTFASPGGAFLLHFTDVAPDSVPAADDNLNGIPDFVEAAAVALDSLRVGYMQLGWRTPVSDFNEYDVYFKDLEGSGFPGYTQPCSPLSSSAPYTAASFIVLDNDFPQTFYRNEPLASLRVTLAHEYHHAIQLAYNMPHSDLDEYQRYIWFSEASATYHEEIFYDGINDYYHYLDPFLEAPEISLVADWRSGNHLFGSVLWALYMAGEYGADANLDVWTIMAEESATPIEAIRLFAAERGVSVLEMYGEFSTWLLHTGDRARPAYYFEEGAAYPEVKIIMDNPDDQEVTLPALAIQYYRLDNTNARGGYALRIRTNQIAEWGVGIVGVTHSLIASSNVKCDSLTGPGTVLSVIAFDSPENVILWAFTGDNVSYYTGLPINRTASLKVVRDSRLVSRPADESLLVLNQNYPNPFRPGIHDATYFAILLGSASDVEVQICSLAGTTLWTKTITDLQVGWNFTDELGVGWNGRNSSGSQVPAGVYLLLVKCRGQIRIRKLTVLR